VAAAQDLNLERRADLETARDILNDAHVKLGTLLEREGVLVKDGVMEDETPLERFHYDAEALRRMETTVRADMRSEGLSYDQVEARDWEVTNRAERQIEREQQAYLAQRPELLAQPGDVIDRTQPYREEITDDARAEAITKDVDAIMATRGSRVQIADAVADEFRSRYPDMPDHLARGLGATYASVVDIYNTRAINAVRLANDTRDSLATATPSARDVDPTRAEAQTAPNAGLPQALRSVLDHERAGELSSPFETDADRQAFRAEVARVLDDRQLDRLTSGDADALDKVLEDRLDRLYVAKVYLQSDAATANTGALRQVVDDLADTEYDRYRAADVDGETERGQIH
jgi:type IV secretion system T-DNA border endonuclease VirD2